MRHQQFKDYYAVLDVPNDASEADIRKAYREAVQFYHPDQHGNSAFASEKLKVVNEAYEVLKDKQKRENYDAVCASRMGGGSSATYNNTASQSPLEKAMSESQDLINQYEQTEPDSEEENTTLQKLFLSLNKIVDGWAESEAALQAQEKIISLNLRKGNYEETVEAARKLGRMANDDAYKNVAAYYIAVGYMNQNKADKALPLLESLIRRSTDAPDFMGDCLCAVVRIYLAQNNIALATQNLARLQREIPNYYDQSDVQNLTGWLQELSMPVDTKLQQVLTKCEFAKEALIDADNSTGEDKAQNIVTKRDALVSLLRDIAKRWHGTEAATTAQVEIIVTYLNYGTDYQSARSEAKMLQQMSDDPFDKMIARLYIGEAFHQERRFDEALGIYNDILLDADIKKNDYVYGRTIYQKGMVYAVQDKHELTVKVFDKLIEEVPDHSDAGDAKRRRDLHQGVITSSSSGGGCIVLFFLLGGAGGGLLLANRASDCIGFIAVHLLIWAKGSL